MDVPEPLVVEQCSGRFVLRMLRSHHRRLTEAAWCEGVCLNTSTAIVIERAFGSAARDEPIERWLVVLSAGFTLAV